MMKAKNRTITAFGLLSIGLLLCVVPSFSFAQVSSSCPLVPTEIPDWQHQYGSVILRVVNGKGYVWEDNTWKYLIDLYDPNAYAKNYHVAPDCSITRVDEKSKVQYPVLRSFADGFENAVSIKDLIKIDRGWTGFTLQSPTTQTTADFVALRQCILNGTCTFRDNRIEPSTAIAKTGTNSLKTLSVSKTAGMITTKASIETILPYFVQGDHFYYSAWYFIDSGKPYTLFDLESDYMEKSPGIRIMLESDNALRIEFKWAGKIMYKQPVKKIVKFPMRTWVHVKVHYYLSAENDGIVQLWQDGRLLIDQKGPTLPVPGAVYNSVEVGTTANNYISSTPTVLYVDDVKFSNTPI